ncbi:Pox virus E6 protein [Orf virus]
MDFVRRKVHDTRHRPQPRLHEGRGPAEGLHLLPRARARAPLPGHRLSAGGHHQGRAREHKLLRVRAHVAAARGLRRRAQGGLRRAAALCAGALAALRGLRCRHPGLPRDLRGAAGRRALHGGGRARGRARGGHWREPRHRREPALRGRRARARRGAHLRKDLPQDRVPRRQAPRRAAAAGLGLPREEGPWRRVRGQRPPGPVYAAAEGRGARAPQRAHREHPRVPFPRRQAQPLGLAERARGRRRGGVPRPARAHALRARAQLRVLRGQAGARERQHAQARVPARGRPRHQGSAAAAHLRRARGHRRRRGLRERGVAELLRESVPRELCRRTHLHLGRALPRRPLPRGRRRRSRLLRARAHPRGLQRRRAAARALHGHGPQQRLYVAPHLRLRGPRRRRRRARARAARAQRGLRLLHPGVQHLPLHQREGPAGAGPRGAHAALGRPRRALPRPLQRQCAAVLSGREAGHARAGARGLPRGRGRRHASAPAPRRGRVFLRGVRRAQEPRLRSRRCARGREQLQPRGGRGHAPLPARAHDARGRAAGRNAAPLGGRPSVHPPRGAAGPRLIRRQ